MTLCRRSIGLSWKTDWVVKINGNADAANATAPAATAADAAK